jgi:hypothetical protein
VYDPNVPTLRLSTGSAVLAAMVNMLLIPLLAVGITHIAPSTLPHAMYAAVGIAVVTVLAWLFRPPLGAVLQIAVGLVIAAIQLVPLDGHFVLPKSVFSFLLSLVMLAPLAGAILAAVVSARPPAALEFPHAQIQTALRPAPRRDDDAQLDRHAEDEDRP